ncbi:MAG: MerR family transcriptional regulator, partial [Candidatus Limnocylindria bacterium]
VTLRRSGVAVTYLGADLPPTEWLEAVKHTNARAAVIAVPTDSDREAAANVVEALRATTPELVVAMGGRGAEGSATDPRLVILPDELRAAARELRLAIGER